MMISVYLAFLYLCGTQDFTSCAKTPTPVNVLTVELGDSLTLNCTYNCASGFIRGHWDTPTSNSSCPEKIRNGNFCTVAVCLFIASAEDVKKNYTCYTEDHEDPQHQKKTERIISLQIQRKVLNLTVSPKNDTKTVSVSADTEDSSGGEFNGIKVLATVTVTVAIVLAALAVYLCVNRNRQNWHGKGESDVSRPCSPQPPYPALLPVKGTPSIQSERVTVRIPPADNESETEVPYADIMIAVRGVSTPELTEVSYLATKRWGEESRCHLQASRSADRLHVPQPREVSRKMSTNSEYAVITHA